MDFVVQATQESHAALYSVMYHSLRGRGEVSWEQTQYKIGRFSSFVNSIININSPSRQLPIGELKIRAGGEDIERARTVSAVDGFIAVWLMLMLGYVEVG